MAVGHLKKEWNEKNQCFELEIENILTSPRESRILHVIILFLLMKI